MKKVKIGVIGCANIAQRSVIPAIKSFEGFELVAVASRSIEKAEKFAKQFDCEPIEGYQNLLNKKEIEAIYLPLPTGLHDEWIEKCIEAKKNVLAEKSFSETFLSCKNLLKKASAKKLVLMENFMFCYHSQHQFIKNLIDSGEIGEIRLFRSSFGFPPFAKWNFRYDKSLGGGSLLDAGAYTVKASQIFLGFEIQAKSSCLYYDLNYGIDLYGAAFLVSKQGIAAELAWGFDNFYQCNYEIWGSKGKIIAERAFTPTPEMKPKIILEQQDKRFEFLANSDNHFINILKEFYRSIVHRDIDKHLNEILNQSRLLEEIRSSSET